MSQFGNQMELTVPLWPRWHIPLGTASPLEKKCSLPCKNNIRDGVKGRKQKLAENTFNYSRVMAERVGAAQAAAGMGQGCGVTSTGRVFSQDAPSPPRPPGCTWGGAPALAPAPCRGFHPAQNPPRGLLNPPGFQEAFKEMSCSPMDPPGDPTRSHPQHQGTGTRPCS